ARQGLQIGSPEEAAWRMGFLSDDQLVQTAQNYAKSGYGAHLSRLLEVERTSTP
ncbi:MAG: glucose-1-phosphate thymidylyltransferase, partial [Dermatophilaceae bacterium]